MKKYWPWALLALSVVVSCTKFEEPNEAQQSGKPDKCGYTWEKTDPVAAFISIEREDDTRKFPGICNSINTWGCTLSGKLDSGQRYAKIFIRGDLDKVVKSGVCNSVDHEIRHALGYSHKETYADAAGNR